MIVKSHLTTTWRRSWVHHGLPRWELARTALPLARTSRMLVKTSCSSTSGPRTSRTYARNGLTVELPQETLHVPIRAMRLCELASVRDKFDIVLMLVKAYDSD